MAGTLRLGITFSNSVSFLDGMLLEYQRKNPQVKYQLYETETSKILDLLRRGIVEIGIARSPFQASSELEFLQERPEHFVAVFRKGDDWFSGRKGPIPIAALAQVPLCIIRRFEPMFSLACQRSSFTPNLVCVNTQLASSILWVREGLAVAVVPVQLPVPGGRQPGMPFHRRGHAGDQPGHYYGEGAVPVGGGPGFSQGLPHLHGAGGHPLSCPWGVSSKKRAPKAAGWRPWGPCLRLHDRERRGGENQARGS